MHVTKRLLPSLITGTRCNQDDVEEMSENHKEELEKVFEKSRESEKPKISGFEEGLT